MEYFKSKEQRQILIFVGIFIVFIVGFFIFLHFPQSRKLQQLREEFLTREQEIEEIKKITEGGKNLEETIVELKVQLGTLEAKIPERETEVIQAVSELAHSYGIGIISITPSKKEAFGSFQIDGKTCYELAIAMKIECSYRTLVDFLEKLTQDFSLLVRSRSVAMVKKDKEAGTLDIDLQMDAYILK